MIVSAMTGETGGRTGAVSSNVGEGCDDTQEVTIIFEGTTNT